MLKRVFILFTCVFLLSNFSLLNSNASYYENEEPFADLSLSANFLEQQNYNADYWLLTAYPVSYSDNTSYILEMLFISDNNDLGKLFFDVDYYPYNTKILSSGIVDDFNISLSSKAYYLKTSSNNYVTSDSSSVNMSSTGFYSSSINGFVFDEFNIDKFPTYQGETSNYTSRIILASNVDLYDDNGNLIQYGNYNTLINYFGSYIDSDRVVNYSTNIEDTTSSDSSETDKEQLETSKGIFGTVKEIFSSIVSLPGKVADAMKGFFTDLKDGLLEGIKLLFIPSDNLFYDLIELVKSKFNFIFQIIEITDVLLNYDYSDTPPDFKISFDTKWGNFDAQLIDLSVFENYRNFVRGIILVTSWYFFIRKLRKRIPDVINGIGSGGDS